MKKILLILSFFIYVSLISGCHLRSKKYWSIEKAKVTKCRDKWVYQDMQKQQEITALLFFKKSRFSALAFPNFIVGTSKTNDTIAFLDWDFEGVINNGDKLLLSPVILSDLDKINMKPLYTISNNSTINDLICSVDTIFYCKIEGYSR